MNNKWYLNSCNDWSDVNITMEVKTQDEIFWYGCRSLFYGVCRTQLNISHSVSYASMVLGLVDVEICKQSEKLVPEIHSTRNV